MITFHDLQAFIIDMDGVLWEGERPLPGLVDFFAALQWRGLKYILATNNASQTPAQYVAKLARMGVTVPPENIIGSGLAAALYLRQQAPNGAKVFAIGEAGVREALQSQGFSLVDLYELDAAFVVCGMDRALSWDKLATATLNIRAGAQFIGTNPDTTLPTERGFTHGNGAILAALQTATEVAPTIIGKPEPLMYEIAMQRLGVEPLYTIAIGDRLGTDILGAVRAGIRSIMVRTGVSHEDELRNLDYAPTWILDDLRAITAAL